MCERVYCCHYCSVVEKNESKSILPNRLLESPKSFLINKVFSMLMETCLTVLSACRLQKKRSRDNTLVASASSIIPVTRLLQVIASLTLSLSLRHILLSFWCLPPQHQFDCSQVDSSHMQPPYTHTHTDLFYALTFLDPLFILIYVHLYA